MGECATNKESRVSNPESFSFIVESRPGRIALLGHVGLAKEISDAFCSFLPLHLAEDDAAAGKKLLADILGSEGRYRVIIEAWPDHV